MNTDGGTYYLPRRHGGHGGNANRLTTEGTEDTEGITEKDKEGWDRDYTDGRG